MEYHLLGKTELIVDNIDLNHADLGKIADSVASVLGLDGRDVAVIDVRGRSVAIDILKDKVSLDQIACKRDVLLAALGAIEGVTVSEETSIHSEGILGLVGFGENQFAEVGAAIDRISRQIDSAVRSRAIVFPTGDEIIKGEIKDTNTSFLSSLLEGLGYKVAKGEPLADSLGGVIDSLCRAADMGYGLVITTGGVGAEDKDHLVEAILTIDPEAATPYVVHYSRSHWRHKKDGVRIAVGTFGSTMFIAIPGPHPEVQLVAPVLVRGLSEEWDKAALAEELARTLQANLMCK